MLLDNIILYQNKMEPCYFVNCYYLAMDGFGPLFRAATLDVETMGVDLDQKVGGDKIGKLLVRKT